MVKFTCCDPVNIKCNKRSDRDSSVRIITNEFLILAGELGIVLCQGDSVCDSCRLVVIKKHTEKKGIVKADEISPKLETTSNYTENIPLLLEARSSIVDNLNKSLSELNESPIVLNKIDQSQQSATKKFAKVSDVLECQVFKIVTKNNDSSDKTEYLEWLDQLKQAYASSESYDEKIFLLTTLPQSWTQKRIEEEFGVSRYMS